MKDKLLKLDKLREEKRELEYFISGSGNFGITIDMTLFKHFGCGSHKLYITDEETETLIFKILSDRLKKINLELGEIIK